MCALPECNYKSVKIHPNLPNIMHVAITVHVILRYTMLTWMHDDREFV